MNTYIFLGKYGEIERGEYPDATAARLRAEALALQGPGKSVEVARW
ncbi:MAG: hypothetical protein GF334_04410 [Candidatus Altiarchaeales archaeon]|nr:hypothetical protein [Candidatus Altiarchaeales archaeon]